MSHPNFDQTNEAQIFLSPNGASQDSLGLRQRRYPRFWWCDFTTPTGLRRLCHSKTTAFIVDQLLLAVYCLRNSLQKPHASATPLGLA